jgi:uncharacterized membrane protein
MDTTWHEIATIGLRWLHILGGILWVGMGLFMNFVHLAYMPALDPPSRKAVILGLVPRVLAFMIIGALVSLASGLTLEAIAPPQTTEARTWLTFGSDLAFTIFFIGALVIVPNMLKVIKTVKNGEPPAPGLLKLLAFFSKLNGYLVVPMIFGMLAGAGHFGHPSLASAAVVCLTGWVVVFLIFWKSTRVSTEV